VLEFEEDRPVVPPKDAATVILMRDAPDDFEVFLIRRHQKSGFMGGAHVFPGGKVDPADAQEAIAPGLHGRSSEEAAQALGEEDHPKRARALFVAAIRETWEEAGVLLGESAPQASPPDRNELLLSAVLRGSVTLRLDWLTPWTRWITPAAESRRYDTRFFLARLPEGQTASDDSRETTASCWMTPQQSITAHDKGEITLPPPTLRSLQVLATYSSAEAAVAEAARTRPPIIEPVFRSLPTGPILALPGDLEHPVAKPALPGSTRFELHQGRWSSSS
jgi:8-oxo-dGTP pyrophosphatase MutT (NUDIX family)